MDRLQIRSQTSIKTTFPLAGSAARLVNPEDHTNHPDRLQQLGEPPMVVLGLVAWSHASRLDCWWSMSFLSLLNPRLSLYLHAGRLAGKPLGSLSGYLPPLSSGFESPGPETLARPSVGKCHGQGSGLFRI